MPEQTGEAKEQYYDFPEPESEEKEEKGEAEPAAGTAPDTEIKTEAAAETTETDEEANVKRIASLEQELAAARADFYNYRQRVTREKQEARRRTEEDMIISLLPVLDNLDRALMVPEDAGAKDVLTGVRMVQRQFLSVLEEHGVTVIPTEGQRFDPGLYEAVGTVPVEDPEEDGAVMSEQLRGYRTKDRVLRAARVTVGRAE